MNWKYGFKLDFFSYFFFRFLNVENKQILSSFHTVPKNECVGPCILVTTEGWGLGNNDHRDVVKLRAVLMLSWGPIYHSGI